MTPRRPKGLPEKISTATGTVLARDAGIITFTTTVDADGNMISQSVSESGPHSEADSDFTLFCQAVTPPLT